MIRKIKLGKPAPAPNPEAKAAAEERADRRLEQKRFELSQQELKAKALDLYLGGKSPRAVADELGLENARAARQLIETAIVEERSEMQDKRREAAELRLSVMLDAYWANAKKGDKHAGGMILEIFDRQAKLYGLNSPIEIKLRDNITAVLHVVKRNVSQADYAKIVAELAQLDSARGAAIPRAGGEALPPIGEPVVH